MNAGSVVKIGGGSVTIGKVVMVHTVGGPGPVISGAVPTNKSPQMGVVISVCGPNLPGGPLRGTVRLMAPGTGNDNRIIAVDGSALLD